MFPQVFSRLVHVACGGVYIRQPRSCWSVKSRAVSVKSWPVDDGFAGSAVPGGVSAAAVAEAGDVSDKDLIGSEGVPIRASRRWVGVDLPPNRGGMHYEE